MEEALAVTREVCIAEREQKSMLDVARKNPLARQNSTASSMGTYTAGRISRS